MTYSARTGTSGRRSAQTYANVGLETQVLGATPEQLISLLFQGALAAIMKARLYMQNQDIPGRGMSISKAIDIVDSGLKASVDTDVGGDLATNLIATYDLVIRQLLLANLNADETQLTLAETILNDLSQAWREAVAETGSKLPAAQSAG